MWPTPPGPYRATTCRGRELIYGSHIYFFDHTRTWKASPDEWSAQCRGHLRDSTNMKDNTHQAHTHSHPNKANMEWWLRCPNDGRGPWGPKVSWHLSDRWGKTQKKETSPRKPVPTGPAPWQARMLPLAPQRWTSNSRYLEDLWLWFHDFSWYP